MRLKQLLQTLAVAGMLVPSSSTVMAEEVSPQVTDKPFAVVNGVAIPSLHADLIRSEMMSQGRPDAVNDDAVQQIILSIEILSQEAGKRALDKVPKNQAMLDLQRKESLAKLLQEDFFLKHTIDDARRKAEYDKAKAEFDKTSGNQLEYHARHILVKDEKTATSLIAQLTGSKKASFAEMAKKHSIDTGSAAQGGDLNWVTPDSLVPEFSQAMAALKKGEITRKPVKSQFGWHVIQLEDTRKLEFPAYAEMKETLDNFILKVDYQKFVADLRAQAKVELPAKSAEVAQP